MTDNEKQHKKLLKEWSEKYELMKHNGKVDFDHFTCDGPSNWVLWESQKPKILFLIKEATGDGWHPCVPHKTFKGTFSENIARWRNFINGSSLNFQPKEELGNINFDDVAFVEIKKINQGKGVSKYKEIVSYAKKDKYNIAKQINLINPDIIFCCNTADAYWEVPGQDWTLIGEEKDKCKCYAQGNRLIIDFWHPSNQRQSPRTDKDLYNLLCTITQNGNFFKKFVWGNLNQKAIFGV